MYLVELTVLDNLQMISLPLIPVCHPPPGFITIIPGAASLLLKFLFLPPFGYRRSPGTSFFSSSFGEHTLI